MAKIGFIEKAPEFFNQLIKQTKLLIITANEIEKAAVHATLKPYPGQSGIYKCPVGSHTYYLGIFASYSAVHVACNEMGSVGRDASTLTVSKAIDDCIPKIALMVGVAFGIDKKKQNIGDVLVSDTVMPYEPQRIGKNKKINRGKPGRSSKLLIDRFKNAHDWDPKHLGFEPKVLPGEILSGEKLVDNKDLRAELKANYPNAIGGEMEGAGLYAACAGRVEWILIKGVCDFADGNKGRKKKENQRLASEAAVSLCVHVFSSPSNFLPLDVSPYAPDSTTPSNVLADLLANQVKRQIKKQADSEKYLTDTFIETGPQKEHLRLICDPMFLAPKYAEMTAKLDFSYLNEKLARKKKAAFKFDFTPFCDPLNEKNYSRFAPALQNTVDFLNRKLSEFEGLKVSSNDTYRFKYKIQDALVPFKCLQSRVGLITEMAGQGKTNFLCDFSEFYLLRREIPTIFLTGVEIDPLDIRATILRKVYPNKAPATLSFEDFLTELKQIHLGESKCFVIIIDGLNECGDPKTLSRNLQTFIEDMQEFPFVRILLSCRTEYFDNNFKNLTSSSFSAAIFKINSLVLRPHDRIEEKLFYTYLNHFGIKINHIYESPYNQLTHNFLLLRIFCEAYQESDLDIVENIYKEELFSKYYDLKCKEINERIKQYDEFKVGLNLDIRNFFERLVGLMIERKTYENIPLDDILGDPGTRQIYARFLDENVLVRKDLGATDRQFGTSEVVNFTFDEFRDFMIAKYLVAKIFPKSKKGFEQFIYNELGFSSHLKEGCSTFLFHMARKDLSSKLNEIIKKAPWYRDVFALSIFSVPNDSITNEDQDFVFELIAADGKWTARLISKLMGRVDESRHGFNVKSLFKFLRTLDEKAYKKVFSSQFTTAMFVEGGIKQKEFLDYLSETLEERDLSKDAPEHNFFEALIYMFLNDHEWDIIELYESYSNKYKTRAKNQLKEALMAQNKALVKSVKEFKERYAI